MRKWMFVSLFLLGSIAFGHNISLAHRLKTQHASQSKDILLVQIDTSGTIRLPSNTAIGTAYPVIFKFTNTDPTRPATGVSVSKGYPPEFTQQTDTCTGQTLEPLTGCQITGTFLKTTPGSSIISVTFNYNESSPVMIQMNTSTENVTLVGFNRVSLPDNTVIGKSYPVIFEFGNVTNDGISNATGLMVSKNYPSGFKETINTCNSVTLKANQGCQIGGMYTPSNRDTMKAGVIRFEIQRLVYRQRGKNAHALDSINYENSIGNITIIPEVHSLS